MPQRPPGSSRASAPASGPALRLRLHGTPRVLPVAGAPVPLEARAAALLLLAALTPGVPRERAAHWLWPDSSDPRRNLRQQLLRFRQQFGRELLVDADGLRLADGCMLEAPDPAELPPSVWLAPCRFDDCDDLEDWLAHQRAQQREALLAPLRAQLAEAEAAGDADAALHAAQRQLALDDQAERHHRDLMRVHYLRGDMAAGIAAYERLEALLAQRFSTRPAAETEQVLALLRAGQPVAAPASMPGTALTVPLAWPVALRRPPRLIGREAEQAAALGHLAEGRAVLLEGEAGQGKSRLLAELTATEADVLRGGGRPGDAGVPYATLMRLLAPLTPTAPLTAAPRPGAMARAVAHLLGQAAVRTMVVDDLHFADEASLDLIAGLIAEGQPPCRWLLAARPAEGPPAVQALRRALLDEQRLGLVAVQALGVEAVADLVATLALDRVAAPALAPAFWRHTGGNPLFLLETLKQGLADGSLARGELPRPQTVGHLIDNRLQRLGEGALTLARVAAVAGVDFCIELAEAVIGVRAVQLASAWGELQDAQVLRDESFAHDLVQDAVLRSLPPVVSRRLHAQCAQWLAAHGGEPARLAWHWRLGGVPAEAGRAFVEAALRAERAARLPEEAQLYAHAAEAFAEAGLVDERFDALAGRVRSLNAIGFDDGALQACRELAAAAATEVQRLRAASLLCDLLTERGETSAARETGEAALALARRIGNLEWQVRTACHLATVACREGQADQALGLLAPLRAWVDEQADDHLKMLWHGDWAATLGHAGRLRDAVAAYEPALAAARRLGLRDAEGRLLLNSAVTLRQSGQFDRALARSREGHALSRDAESGQAEADSPIDTLVLAREEAESGGFAAALPALESALAAFERRGAAFWRQACAQVMARLWLDLGQLARAGQLLRAEPAADLPPWLRADRGLLRLALAEALGQPLPAGVLDDALALAAQDAQRGPALRVRALRWQAPDEALAASRALAGPLAAQERLGSLLALHVHVAHAAGRAGQVAEAAQAARAAMALWYQGCAPESMYRPLLHHVACQALSAAGLTDEAARALQAGVAWVRDHALPQVPAPFLDSFLRRNRVNAELLDAVRAA